MFNESEGSWFKVRVLIAQRHLHVLGPFNPYAIKL